MMRGASCSPPGAPRRPCSSLPARAGIGLKPVHFQALLATRPAVGFLEVHAENYMVDGGPLPHYLARLRADHALSLHGVSLSLGGAEALDLAHLERLATHVRRYTPASFSEHLAWSRHGGVFVNDLLPVAYDAPTLERVCRHIDQVQSRLGLRMLLENPATYLLNRRSTLSEEAFLCEVTQRTGCGLLLDLTNAYVSCINHRRDVRDYLAGLPLHVVGEIHLAGHTRQRDADGGELLIDNHGSAVDESVWSLYAEMLTRLGPIPTLIERDNHLPALTELLREAWRAETLMAHADGLERHASS